MILQSGIKYRSFSEQSSFSFSLDASPYSWSGDSVFGVSGSAGSIDLFKFKNGKLFDPLNRFVYSYSNNDNIGISGNYSSGNFGYWINGNPVALNLNIANQSRTFSEIYVSTSKAALDFDVNIYGYKLPTYNFSFIGSPTGKSISGLFLNTSPDSFSSFKIFSGEASFNYSGYGFSGLSSNFNLQPGKTGSFLFRYSGDGSDYSLSESSGINPLNYNLLFYTSFGTISKTGALDLSYNPLYFIDFYTINSGFNQTTSNYFWSYYLEGKLCTGSPFGFKLEKISGFNYKNTKTGFLEFTGLGTGVISGNIYGTGFLNGRLSGNLKTNQLDYYGSGLNPISFTGMHSGQLIYQTGYINATGLRSKQGISGDIFGTGYVTDIYREQYVSIKPDIKINRYFSGSGVFYQPVLTGITGSKSSSETYKHWIPGTVVCKDLSPIMVTGTFTGANTGSINYSGFVLGSGAVYSSIPYTLLFTGRWTGATPGGSLTGVNMTSGVTFTSPVLTTGAAFNGASSINYSKYSFSGGTSFYLDSNNNLLSGNYVLDGLTGSFNINANTNSGTFFYNKLLSGGADLPLDTGNFYAYVPAYANYPIGCDSSSLPTGYSIETNINNLCSVTWNQNPLKYGMGSPLDWSHKDTILNPPSYFEHNSTPASPYIKITFNASVASAICDSYCVAPHPEYPSVSSWILFGSNDNINWNPLHTVIGENLEKNYLRVFNFNNSTYYRYLRFSINGYDNPLYHIPAVSQAQISNNSYLRGFAKFVPLKKIKINKYLSRVVDSIPVQSNNNNITGSWTVLRSAPNAPFNAFDKSSSTSAILDMMNLNSNNSTSRGIILNKNLNSNGGASSLSDLSSAAFITSAECGTNFNFYGGSFASFRGVARTNFAATDKNNNIAAVGPTSFTNPVIDMSATGDRVVVCSSGTTRFLSGTSLAILNTDTYSSILFGAADPYNDGWRLGAVFSPSFSTVNRTASYSFNLQPPAAPTNYILNNGLIFTNLIGQRVTGFPLVRNSGASSPLNWESGVDSDGFSQLRYNLHNEQTGLVTRPVGVSGIITHDLFIPKIGQTKKITYIFGDITSSKMFKGRGSDNSDIDTLLNPQGKNLFAQRMSDSRHALWNYEFRNSGWSSDTNIRSIQVDEFGKNLIVCGDGTGLHPNKGKLYFLSLPTESAQFPIAQDLKNNYNGVTNPAITGLTSGGFIAKINPIFNCDGTIRTSLLSGASGLFIGGDFINPRINSVASTSTLTRAILLNTSGNNQIGSIVTGYSIGNNSVLSMELDQFGRIYIGGSFTAPQQYFVSYNALNPGITPIGGSNLFLNGSVNGIYYQRSQNKLYLGGDFTSYSINNTVVQRAMRLSVGSSSISADTTWLNNPGFNQRVQGIISGFNNEIIFYGNFSRFGNSDARFVAKFSEAGNFITGGSTILDANGAASTAGTSTIVGCEIDRVDKSIYVIFSGNYGNNAGDMQDNTDPLSSPYNYSYRRAIRYNYDTLKPSGVAPSFAHGAPSCLKYWNNRMIFGGGKFNTFGQFNKGIAAFLDEPTGNLFMDFNPNLNGSVSSACKVSDGLILAGDFTSCQGLPASGLVKVDFFGNRISAFSPNCQNPGIVKIKNTPSGVFAFSTRPWNSNAKGNFYRINPANGSILKNYYLNLSDSSYAGGDFFIEPNTASSIGHVVIGNIKSFNPGSYIEYIFPNPINSIQGYDIAFANPIPSSFILEASGINDTTYRTVENVITSASSSYSDYNIDYPLSGIKRVRFNLTLPDTSSSTSINEINIYEKVSGSQSGMRLYLGHVRGSGIVSRSAAPYVLYTGLLALPGGIDPSARLYVDALYEQTGIVLANKFENYLDGSFRASGIGMAGNFQITPASGSAIINRIKLNSVTGSSRASLNFKLKNGINNIFSNSDSFIFNTGSFYSLGQSFASFKYFNNSSYEASNPSHFSGIEDFVYKVNTFHSAWLSGNYNSTTRNLTLTASSSIGEYGNLMYMQPIIRSGLSNFFDSSFTMSTTGFYFTGGSTSYLNMNTGVSGFYSGFFDGGEGIYVHEQEYRKISFNNLNSDQSNLEIENAFTGFVSIDYSGLNDYSNIFYATGSVNYNYNVRLTGLASGYNPTTKLSGIVPAIIYKAGTLSTGAVNGVGSWTNFLITGTGSPGNVYTIPSGGNDFTQAASYWTGNFSGLFNFSAQKTGYYSIITGIPVLQITGTGWTDYDAKFDWNFDIKTGALSSSARYSGVSLKYSSGIGAYTGSGFLDKTLCLPFVPAVSKYVKFEINHYLPYNSGNNVMRYTLSGSTPTGLYIFSGLIFE